MSSFDRQKVYSPEKPVFIRTRRIWKNLVSGKTQTRPLVPSGITDTIMEVFSKEDCSTGLW